MRLRSLSVLAAVAALACNKSGTAPQSGVSANCEVTLSGSTGGTYDCRPATTLWTAVADSGGFSFGVTASGSRPAISVGIVWAGEPADGTYGTADSTAHGEVIVTDAANHVWEAAFGQGTATGGYSLTFTSVVESGVVSGGKGYAADGTLNATLLAVTATGASGVVVLTATF